MRTIGKKNKTLVRKLTQQAFDRHERYIFEYVKEKLPLHVFDTWEGAYNEVERLVDDIIMEDWTG